MREHYIEKINSLKNQYENVQNQFNCISGINLHDKTIDALIMQMNGIETIINSVYLQAKANNIILN